MHLLVHPNSAGQHLTSFQPLLSTTERLAFLILHRLLQSPSYFTLSMRSPARIQAAWWPGWFHTLNVVFVFFVCLFEGLCALYCVQDNYPPMAAVLLLKVRFLWGRFLWVCVYMEKQVERAACMMQKSKVR